MNLLYWEQRACRFASQGDGLAAVCSYGMPAFYNRVIDWIRGSGRRIPEDIGVIQLEWRASRPEIAGMNQHNRVTGEAAVDMVVSQIHNNESGLQEFPRSTMIGATWVDGASVRAVSAATRRGRS